MDEKEITWTAPEFEPHYKGYSWYWLSVIFTVLIVAYAVWRRNFLFGIFAALAEIMLIYWARKKPREVKFKLTGKGLHIDSKLYSFEEFNGFAVHDTEIILRRKAKLSVYLKIFAYGDEIEQAKKFLDEVLPTFEYEESLIDHIARIIRF